MNPSLDYPALDDARLVELHRAGDRLAFREIVERHQAAVNALTLSACGELARSEDLAQEVFIAAWKQLPALREPAKLRGWLCGIARNLAHNALRGRRRVPVRGAVELPADAPGESADPRAQAVTAEEQALMWRGLASLPETYREPMVLFYREHRSAAAVAATLEISEELVRQRLARGRAMLTERMAHLVEEALERSAPKPSAFAGAVLVGLPFGLAPTAILGEAAMAGGGGAKTLATAGTVGVAAVKGGLAVKLLAAWAVMPVLMTGVTDYLRFRGHYATADAANRRAVAWRHVLPLIINASFLGAMFLLFQGRPGPWKSWALAAAAVLFAGSVALAERRRKAAARGGDAAAGAVPVFEYRSAANWLGLPLVHLRVGGPCRQRRAIGWIALSDGVAFGGIAAGAPLAIAPVALGGVVLGGVALGAFALGAMSLGVMAAGWWAAGAIAVAPQAALGAIAIAQTFASGVIASAAHANDAAATAFFDAHRFFAVTRAAWRVAVWATFFTWVPPLLLIAWDLRHLRRENARLRA